MSFMHVSVFDDLRREKRVKNPLSFPRITLTVCLHHTALHRWSTLMPAHWLASPACIPLLLCFLSPGNSTCLLYQPCEKKNTPHVWAFFHPGFSCHNRRRATCDGSLLVIMKPIKINVRRMTSQQPVNLQVCTKQRHEKLIKKERSHENRWIYRRD